MEIFKNGNRESGPPQRPVNDRLRDWVAVARARKAKPGPTIIFVRSSPTRASKAR